MKKYSYIIALLMAVVVLAGCENYETYSDMKKKEQEAIEAFISEQGIQVIDQTTSSNTVPQPSRTICI